jgi:hypothetical protein
MDGLEELGLEHTDEPITVDRYSASSHSGYLTGPWFATTLSLVGIGSWLALALGLLSSSPLFWIVWFGAWPVALAGTVLAVRSVVFHKTPRWAALLSVGLGLAVSLLIPLENLRGLFMTYWTGTPPDECRLISDSRPSTGRSIRRRA